MELHVYDNGNDIVFAPTEKRANEILAANYGTDPEPNGDVEPVRQLNNSCLDKVFTFRHEDGGSETKTMREFMLREGEGLFASREI